VSKNEYKKKKGRRSVIEEEGEKKRKKGNKIEIVSRERDKG